jgi:serine/threonine protein kinase
VVHGDIKPGNILMAQDIEEDVISVGLADFGFSPFSESDDDLVYVPRSEPWEAPERHIRESTLRNAKKMDIYSFGLLCLWIFFKEEYLSDLGFPLAKLEMAFSGTNREATAAIQAIKKKEDAMLDWALQLLEKKKAMTDQTRSCLEKVFRLTLIHDSNDRDATMETLVQTLSGMQDLT